MRYLLTFHSDATGQWRILDTAALATFTSGRAEDIPAALRREPEIAMRWLLGCYEFPDPAEAGAGALPLVAVYPLDPSMPRIGLDNEYRGPWLEMFRHDRRPTGWIALRRPRPPARIRAERRPVAPSLPHRVPAAGALPRPQPAGAG